jgi:hypothetical protein
MQRITLRMVLVGRISTIVGVWLCALIIIALLDNVSSNAGYQVMVTLVPLLLAIPVTVRLARFGVDATADTVTVRGYRWPKPIPIRSITEVKRGRMPVISWTDEDGDQRVTYIPGLRADTTMGWSNRRARQAVAELADWVERHGS